MALPDLNQFVAAPDPSGRAADPAVALTQTDSLGLPDLNQFVAAPDPEGRVADAELRQFVPEHDGKGLADEFVSGLSGGVDNLQMTLFGVAGLAGRELGIKTLEDFGIRGAERNVVEAQNSGRESGGFTDIETAGGFFKWAAASLGEALPSLGLAIAGGGVGGVLAKKAVEGGVRRAIRDRVVKDLLGKGFSRREAAESAVRFIGSKQGNTLLSRAASTGATRAGTVGRAFGAAGASIPPQVGAIDLELQERGIDAGLTALLGGVVGGALEALPAIRLMDKMFPGVQTQVAKSFVKDFAVSVGAQTMIEGSTEAAQEMIQLAAMAYHDPSFDLFDPANANRVIDAFAAGAIVGTVTGGGAEAIGAVTSPRKLAPPVEVEEFALDDDTDKTPEGFTPADNTLFEEVRGRILGVVAPMIEPAVNSLSGAAKKAFSALDSDMGGGMHREATKLSQVIKDGHNRFLETHAAELTQLKEYIKNKSAEVYRIAETFSDPELRSQFIKDEMEVVRANVEGLSNKLKERAAKRDEQTSAEVDNMDFSDVDVADIFEQEAPVVDERQVPDVGDVDAVPVMTFGRNQLSPKVGVSGKETVVAYKTQADARKGRTKLKLKFPGAKNDAFRIAKHESGKGWVIEGIDPTLRDDVKFWNDFDSARDSGGRRRNNPRKVTLKGVDGTQFGYKFKNLIIDVATMAFKGKNLDPNATTMQQGFRAFAGEMLSRGIINNDQFTELETAANKVLDADAIIEEAPLDKEQTRAQRQTELANASRIEREFSGNATLGQTGLPSSATPSSGDLGDTRGNIAGAPDASVSVSNEGGVEVKDFAVDPQKDDRVTDPKTKPSEFESRFSRFDKATGKVDRSNRDNAKELSAHDKKILARYGKPGAFKMLTSINMPFAVQSALSSIGNFVTKRLGLSNQVTMVDDHGLQLLIDRGIVSDPIFQQTLTDPAVHARNIRIGDQSFVYLSQKVLSDPVTTIAAFGHEMGHHLYRVAWDKLTPEAQQRLRSAYEAQAKSPSDAGFNEWMADQLAAWIVRPIRQGGDPGQFFFQKVAQNVRKLYDFITKNPRFQLDETFQQFADAVALKVTTDVDPEANPYNQALLKAWFRDEGVTMYEWFGDTLESDNMDFTPVTAEGKKALARVEKKYPAMVKRALLIRNWMVAAYKMAIAPSTSAVRDMIPRIPTAARLVTMFNREAHGEAKIAQNYHQALELMRGQFIGKFTKMRNGIATQIKAKNPGIKNKELQKLINARMREIGQSLQSKDSDPNATFTKEEQVIRDLFDNMHAYALKAGLPVHKVVNYFPRQFSRKLLVDNKQKILDHLTAGKMPLEAARSLYNSLIDPTANDGRATQDATETPGFKAMNSRTVQDKFFDQFLDDDTQGIVGNYINQVTKRAEFNRRLGERMPVSELTAKEAIAKGIWDPKGKMHKILAQAKKEGATDEDLVVLENYIDANLGQLGRDSALAKPGARRFMAAVMAYQNMRVLMFTVFASLPDGAGPAIRSGSMRDTWKVLKNQIGDMASQEGDLAQMARTLGIIQDAASDHIMTEYVDNHYMPAKLRKMNDSFFKYTGLNWYTDFTRKYALAVGIDYIEQSYNNSLNGATAQEKARGKDMLAELGMTPAQAKEWIAAGKPTYDSQAHDMKGSERAAAEALIQFVDESIMRPNASQRPILASHPGAMLVYHLKGYMYAVHDIILKRVKFNIDEAESPAQYVAAISPAIAMMLLTAVGLELRELIQYAGSDRKPPTDRMDGWEYTWELSQRSGLTGFAQIGFDFEGAGDRGMSQVAGIGGPALSQAANIISRPSTQTIPKAIPIIGQIPAAREIVRDVIK